MGPHRSRQPPNDVAAQERAKKLRGDERSAQFLRAVVAVPVTAPLVSLGSTMASLLLLE